MTANTASDIDISTMFRPPVEKGMQSLNRAFFVKTVPLAAVKVLENKDIAPCRKKLSRDLLDKERVSVVQPSQGGDGRASYKSLLLRPDIRPEDSSTWTPTIKELIEQKKVNIEPFNLVLDYNYWNYMDIMQAVWPEDGPDELPTGFATIGHIAHLNLRDRVLPYKHLIAQVILDKNPQIQTVINKTDLVGTQSEFRTFQYELLAGDPSMEVEVREQNCTFRFDYSKVYWNSRLNTEHERLVNLFKPGEAVCDVMAGVGPFAVPAGARKVFVWANDLNPNSFEYLQDAVEINKVQNFVSAFNQDGREFIRNSAKRLMAEPWEVDITPKTKGARSMSAEQRARIPRERLRRPVIFGHYVMNLPATAIEFLDAFIGLYKGQEELFEPATGHVLPKIHVHCFSSKSDDNVKEHQEICERISAQVGYKVEVGKDELEIWDVRDVAPNKRMFCASFRLPPAVAFR